MEYYSRTLYTDTDGIKDTFLVPFEYMDRSHVQVRINGVNGYIDEWIGDSVKLFPVPDANVPVLAFRQTPTNERFVSWKHGEIPQGKDIDTDSVQQFYILQELLDELNASAVGDSNAYVGFSGQPVENSIVQDLVSQVLESEAYQLLDTRLEKIADLSEAINRDSLTIYQNRIDSLKQYKRIGDAEASISQEAEIRLSEDSALAQLITELNTSVSDNYSEYQNAIVTLTDADQAIAQDLTNLETQYNTNKANVESSLTALSDEDAAIAQSLTTLDSKVDDNLVTVQQNIQTEAQRITETEAVLNASWSVRIDNNGHVSGFGLTSESGAGETTSDFVIRADKFSLVGTDPNNPQVPFVVDSQTGTVGIDGQLLVDGSIYADKIYANSLGIDQIKTDEISADIANLGVLTGGTIRTAASGTRLEISKDGHFPLWYGSGVKNDTNATFSVDVDGNAFYGGNLKANIIEASHVGTNTIIANSANIGDEVVETSHIKNLLVDTAWIKSGAITNSFSQTSGFQNLNIVTSGSGWSNVASGSLNITEEPTLPASGIPAGKVKLNFSATINGALQYYVQVYIRIRRNGITIYGGGGFWDGVIKNYGAQGTGSAADSINFVYVDDNPTVGNCTYTFEMYGFDVQNTGILNGLYALTHSVWVLEEVKR